MRYRFYAFLKHLMLTGLVAALAIVMVFFVWYPIPLNEAAGVTDIYLILLAVDVVIGPVMTFVVFKPGKPGLFVDLTVIVVLQLMALSYGMFTVFEGRPVFIVFDQDRFDLVRPIDIDPESLKKARLEGNKLAEVGWLFPRWVGAVESKDSIRGNQILFSAVAGGPDWPQLPELYVPLEQVKSQMLKKARAMSELRKIAGKNENSEDISDIEDSNTKWLPMRGKAKDMTVLIDATTAKVIRIVNINPWLY
jgi:hypothetical protein